MKKTIKVHTKLNIYVLYVVSIILIYFLPRFKVTLPYVLVGMWMLIFLIPSYKCNMKSRNFIYILLASSIYIFIADIFIADVSIIDSLNEFIRNIRFYIPLLFLIFFMKNPNKHYIKQIIIAFIGINGYILYKTYSALIKDQWITRVLAKSKMLDTPELRNLRLQNVGGFEFSYMIGVVTICLTWTTFKAKNKKIKICSGIMALITYLYIIKTMYTTLLLLTTFGIMLVILFNLKHPVTKIAVVAGFIMMFTLLPAVFLRLSEIFSESLLSTKFIQMHDALTGGGVNALGSRSIHLENAFEIWMKNPIFGGFAKDTKSHSFIMSILEKNGLIGFLIFVNLIIRAKNIVCWYLKNNKTSVILFYIVLVYMLLLSFLNPIGYIFEITITVFFIVPLWAYLIDNT